MGEEMCHWWQALKLKASCSLQVAVFVLEVKNVSSQLPISGTMPTTMPADTCAVCSHVSTLGPTLIPFGL